MLDWAGTRITDGTAQADRITPALQAGYFNVDELVFEELLALTTRLAAQVRFYDLNHTQQGNWEALFTADEAVIMALILSTNLKLAEAEFLRIAAGDTARLARNVLQWAEKIDFWFQRLAWSRHPSGLQLRHRLHVLIAEKLQIELQSVCSILDQLAQQNGSEERIDLARFAPVWGIKREGERFVYAKLGDAPLDPAQYPRCLQRAFYTFHHAINHLKTQVPALLQSSLSSQQHAPAVGLYLVFLRLFERAQQRLNQFTQRHLDFYYHQVLQAQPRARQPESVCLRFTCKPGSRGALIDQGTLFTAGKDSALKERVYRAENALLVTDARISALHTLNLQHDGLISPEAELDYVTRIKTHTPPLPQAEHAQTPWPLFGVSRRSAGGEPAELGFALASTTLLLQEGIRQVALSIHLKERVAADVREMVAGLRDCGGGMAFRQQCGKLFSCYLLYGPHWLSKAHKQEIIAQAAALLDDNSAREIGGLLMQDWQGLFYRLFKRTFSIRLTAATGWLEIADPVVTPLGDSPNEPKQGFNILFTLGQEAPAIIPYRRELHGDLFTTGLPLLCCRINPLSHFYPYSLFDDLLVDRLSIEVDVKGVKNILAYNKHGQLDPSKPFQPFGPLPTRDAYFVLGNHEIASKRLIDLRLNLEWGELPSNRGGFAEHYRHYAVDFTDASFKGRFEALVDGQWRAPIGPGAQPLRLFENSWPEGALLRGKSLDVGLLDDLKPIDRDLSEGDFGYSLKTRNGFFRLVLSEPANAFGHRLYPELLSRVLTRNARLKKPQELPNQPYTPSINQIALDYRTRVELKPSNQPDNVGDPFADTLWHLHPFGVEVLYPARHDKPVYLLPQYQYQGNLFIGLQASELAGPLSLFFHLAEDLSQEGLVEAPELAWFYLACDGWRPLPAGRVHEDTTDGFLTSGVQRLDIPADIERGNRLMPGDLYWLRLSARKDLHGFCSCYSIQPHALKVTRLLDESYSIDPALAQEVKWQPLISISGLDGLWQAGKPFGGRPAETPQELTIRFGERLRHKNRALTAWDYEHLILERFPQVAKVKCFSHMSSESEVPRPGQVLIVVVPQAQAGVDATCDQLMLSAVELARIRTHVQRIAPSGVSIEVRNPLYEQVQVRCTVKFTGGANAGFYVDRLDRAISQFICPWCEPGYRARFGWSIRQKDLEAYLRGLEYVAFVTDFSMLHIIQDRSEHYRLSDTVRDQYRTKVQLDPRFPWSLAVPARHHFIQTMTTARHIEAQVTGVDELEIGSTFIIGNSGYGEKE